ncbi:oligosaccharide flippase family protein [Agrilactobacillus fermenti]|uniref:oligosaccharide flippase family protein n=1 Tax=Agrilactobacillus fermenti TaxID=2586909 RepID=UPI003A5BC7C4
MKVLKNYMYNAGYQILNMIIPLFTYPYITRVLSRTGIGINTSTNSVVNYFLLVGQLGIMIYGNREIATVRDDPDKRTKVFWEITFLKFITIAVAYVAFLIFLNWEYEYQKYFFFQSFLIIAGAFDISWFFMGLEDFRKTVLRNMLVKIVSTILIFTLIKQPSDLGAYILILTLSQLLGNLTLWPYLKNLVGVPKYKELNILRHFSPALILLLPQIAVTLYTSLNRTLIWKLDNVTAAGFFDLSDKIIQLLLTLVTSLGVVLLPHMAHLFGNNKMDEVKSYLYKSANVMLGLSVALTFGIMAVSQKFVLIYYGRPYQQVGELMAIQAPVIIFIALSNLIGQQYLLPTRRNKQYTVTITVGSVLNVIFSIPAILTFGVEGAMYAAAIAELAVTVSQLIVVRHELDFKQLFSGTWKYLLAGLVMGITIRVIDPMLKLSILNLALEVVLGGAIYVVLNIVLRTPLAQMVRAFVKEH